MVEVTAVVVPSRSPISRPERDDQNCGGRARTREYGAPLPYEGIDEIHVHSFPYG